MRIGQPASMDRNGRGCSQRRAYKPPCQCQGQGLDQELLSDIAATSAERHPQTDFSGALSHGNQHDVHVERGRRAVPGPITSDGSSPPWRHPRHYG